MQLELPRVVDGQGVTDTRAGVRRIPGGMLVDIRPYGGTPEPLSVMVAVDADGSIRWQRCLDPAPDVVRVADRGDPDEFLVGWNIYGAEGLISSKFEVWSLADGTIARTWDEVLAANGITGAPTRHRWIHWLEDDPLFVLGSTEARAVEPSDTMLVVDLATMAMRLVPYAPSHIGLPLDAVRLRVTNDGRLLGVDVDAGVPGDRVLAVESAESAGGWSTDVDDVDEAVGIQVDFAYSDTPRQSLVGVDSRGHELWRLDDVLAIRTEGFSVAVDGDIALASACSDLPQGDDWCPGPKLLAVDTATGRTLWQRDGRWGVSVIGDGRAMIAGPYLDFVGEIPPASPPWLMIDLATGEQVGTTTWTDPWRFGIGCCDAPEGASVAGGVVFTVDEETVEMWYPQALSAPLHRTRLDDTPR